MSDIFQEVEEEFRREQMAKFWEKYRIPVIAGVTVLVLGVAGYQGWTYWKTDQIEKSSRAFDRAAELVSAPGQEKQAADSFGKLSESGFGAYAIAARFQEAALRAELGQIKEAVVAYEKIAGSASDPLFADYARLRAALLVADSANYDAMKRRLDPVVNGNGPWKTMAQELLAYTTWRAGKSAEALKLYEAVQKAEDVTPGTKRRALEMSALITVGMKPSDVKDGPSQSDTLLPPTGGSLLPQITPEASSAPQPTEEQPSSLLGAPESQPPSTQP